MGEMFVLMTALSCAVAHWLVYHPTLGAPIRRYGHRIMPFVLINLGLPTFLTQGFRPFFLAAGIWSAAALALLAGLWLLGRIACLVSALVPTGLAIAADLSFPVVLVAVVAREIVAGRNWRNLPLVAPVTVLGIANLLMHLEADGVAVPARLGWRLGLATVIVLISVMAGRIVPSFTRNWLAKRRDADLPAVPGWIDRSALGVLHAGLFGWAFFPALRAVGLLLLLGAVLNLWRLLRWRDGRGAAASGSPCRLCLARARCGVARPVNARRRSAAKRRHPRVDRRGDRHDDSGGDDAGHARPHWA